ncbi:hypothetical protein C0992_000977 [Termitomyces sp. T32_za158]|nr:hypothetical protein C0992_000977 [Termitomyces sp. T32_za158]
MPLIALFQLVDANAGVTSGLLRATGKQTGNKKLRKFRTDVKQELWIHVHEKGDIDSGAEGK